MTIHNTGENGLTLFLDADDLAQLGNIDLNENTARKLVKTTLKEMGINTGAVEISAFFGKGGAMVVALLGDKNRQPWCFYKISDSDTLLDVWKLSEKHQRKYFKLDNAHYIAFPENDEPCGISEYGKRLYRPQAFLSYLEEHAEK
jgi:hypothetical protein